MPHPRCTSVLLLLAITALTGCGGESTPNDADASTPRTMITCNPGETLYAATCPSSGACLVRNAEIGSAMPTTNHSAETAIDVGAGEGGDLDALLGFDLGGVPPGAMVTRGVVTLTTGPEAASLSSGSTTITQNLGPWDEMLVTYDTAPGFGSTLGSESNTTAASSSWSITLPTSLVQGWIGTSATNHGVRIKGSGGTAKENFIASKNADVASRPRLDVCYVPAPPPPPPTGCTNGMLDGTESDLDCGGACAAKCADTAACNGDSDCAHGLCITGTCRPLGGESIAVVQDCTLPAPAGVTPIDVQFGTDPAQWLTLYIPPGTPPSGGWPVVTDWHPGGGNMGMMDDLASHCQVLAAQGRACVTIDYRFFTGAGASSVDAFPAAVNDGRCATRWLRTYAEDYGLNGSAMSAACYSFGCAVAGKVATEAGLTTPGAGIAYDDATCPLSFSPSDAHPFVAVADYYGNTDFTVPGEWSAYDTNGLAYLHVTSTSDPAWAARAAAASVTWGHGDPELFISGDPADTTVLHAQLTRLYNQARARGVDATLLDQSFGHGSPPIYWNRVPVGCTPPACTQDAHPATCTLDAFLTQ